MFGAATDETLALLALGVKSEERPSSELSAEVDCDDDADDDDDDALLPVTRLRICSATDPVPAPEMGPRRPALSRAAAAAPKRSEDGLTLPPSLLPGLLLVNEFRMEEEDGFLSESSKSELMIELDAVSGSPALDSLSPSACDIFLIEEKADADDGDGDADADAD